MSDSKRHQRRLKLAQRQMALAKIARREAMGALADAVEEEERSIALARRSADIIGGYASRAHPETAQALQESAAFLRGLRDVSAQAEKARHDASQQAEWQMQALAKAERRATRFEEQARDAKREIESIETNRELPVASRLARKLHSQ